jgi:hypothetical protein
MSRYESAFLKMARAAGFSDPHAVIQRFLHRHEDRARMLQRREHMQDRLGALEVEHKRMLARMGELQHLMVHPPQADAELREVEPRLTSAQRRLDRSHEAVGAAITLRRRVMSGLEHLQLLIDGPFDRLADGALDGALHAKLRQVRESRATEKERLADPHDHHEHHDTTPAAPPLERPAHKAASPTADGSVGWSMAGLEHALGLCEVRLLALMHATKDEHGQHRRPSVFPRDLSDAIEKRSPPRENNVRVKARGRPAPPAAPAQPPHAPALVRTRRLTLFRALQPPHAVDAAEGDEPREIVAGDGGRVLSRDAIKEAAASKVFSGKSEPAKGGSERSSHRRKSAL